MFNYIDLFHQQLIYGSILGIIMVIWFATELAQRDSDDWKEEYSTPKRDTHLTTLSILLGVASIILFVIFVIQWINSKDTVSLKLAYDLHFASDAVKNRWFLVHYESMVMLMILGFQFATFSCYVFRFRPSPRSKWVKIRKGIAYYLVNSFYMAFVLYAEFDLRTIGSSPETLGRYIAYGIYALIVWLLLRHYKNEKYIPYKEALESTDKEEILSTPTNTSIKKHNQKRFSKKNGLLSDKKRRMAYYLLYEIVLFLITFVIIIIDIIEEYELIGIYVAIFVVLSALPIGIYWVIRLLNESSGQ